MLPMAQYQYPYLFFKILYEHMSFYGATDTPVLDFW